jgi:hypothetical protein
VNPGLIITELFHKNCVILVVEDIPLIRMGAVDLRVVDAGFEAQGAGSAKKAIRILEGRPNIDGVHRPGNARRDGRACGVFALAGTVLLTARSMYLDCRPP